MKSLEQRLARLEQSSAEPFSDLLRMIAAGCSYADLDNEQQEQYATYIGIDRTALEQCELAVNGSLHFPLERRKPKPKAVELQTIAAEIEKLIMEE